MRIVIVGSPRSGKSTLAQKLAAILDVKPQATDELIGLGWGNDSAEAAKWFDAKGPWVIEGTGAVRALRKWLKANPEGSPADIVLYRGKPKEELTPGQARMATAVGTMSAEVFPQVEQRGAVVLGC
jgi:adenylate kinase family enzyme